MNLNEYLSCPHALTATELSERIGVKNVAQVRQWQHGYANRIPSPENCVAIEQATKGQVMRWDLRPTDWHLIWPELKRRGDAPEISAAEQVA